MYQIGNDCIFKTFDVEKKYRFFAMVLDFIIVEFYGKSQS